MRMPWSRKEPEPVLYTSVSCEACSKQETRLHADGDTVFESAKCAHCGGPAVIDSIYAKVPTQ